MLMKQKLNLKNTLKEELNMEKDEIEIKNTKKFSAIYSLGVVLIVIALIVIVGFYSHGKIAKEFEDIGTSSSENPWSNSQVIEEQQKENSIDSTTLNNYIMEINTANAAMDSGEYDEAIEGYLAAIDIDPNEESAYIGLANAYKNNGEKTKALETLKSAYAKFGSDSIKSLLDAFN